MEKIYISAGQLLADSFRLGSRVHRSGFRPDFMLGVWRGGAPVAIAMHEYLTVRKAAPRLVAIAASSYSGIDRRARAVEVTGLEAIQGTLTRTHSILIVDDVFDTGLTMQAILAEMERRTGARLPQDIRIACPWFKPERNRTSLRPHFHLRETSAWLVFPHELEGLSPAERIEKPDLAEVLPELDLP